MVILILRFFAGSAVAGSKDSAPPAPNRPWTAPGLAEHQADLQNRHLEIGNDSEVNPHKVYELPDLIDLAQRLNPETKISWQRAKEALAAVGLKEVTYIPCCRRRQQRAIPGFLHRSLRLALIELR